MARYNREDLNQLCEKLNARQELQYQPQSRNGYTAVDLYQDGKCRYNLAIGTPKECAFAVMQHALDC